MRGMVVAWLLVGCGDAHLSGDASLPSRDSPVPRFAPHVDVAAGATPWNLAIVDLDGDGKPEIVVSNRGGTNTLSILRNHTVPGGMPSFATGIVLPTGDTPGQIVIADFNGDGKPDLAVANLGSATISIFLNTTATNATTPTFATRVDIPTGPGPGSLAVGDFNGDNKPDLAVGTTDHVSVLLDATVANGASPSFAPAVELPTGVSPTSLATGDYNGDGKLDLAALAWVAGMIPVFGDATVANSMSASFELGLQLVFRFSTPTSIAAGDFNGDGKLDLAGRTDGTAAWVRPNTTVPGTTWGTFGDEVDLADAGPSNTLPGTGQELAVGDLDGDGLADLAVAHVDTNGVAVLFNDTHAGAFTPHFAAQAYSTGASPASVAIADLDGDGKLDVITANSGDATVSVLLGE